VCVCLCCNKKKFEEQRECPSFLRCCVTDRKMSGGGGSSTFRVPIPNNVRKTIQDIREITGKQHTDDEIYAVLKECSMDPNETAQKLLYLGPFHFSLFYSLLDPLSLFLLSLYVFRFLLFIFIHEWRHYFSLSFWASLWVTVLSEVEFHFSQFILI